MTHTNRFGTIGFGSWLSIFVGMLLFSSVMVGSCKSIEIKTTDDLKCRFAANGELQEVVIDGKKLPGLNSGGLYLRVAQQTAFQPVLGKISSKSGKLTFTGTVDGLKLGVKATYMKCGDWIDVEGSVLNLATAERERCVDLRFLLPMDCRGWKWGADLADEELIEKSRAGAKSKDGITIYPFAPVSQSARGVGLTIAVPPTHPTLFDTGADETGLFLTLKVGLSDATKPANETAFRFIIYRHDPEWGFRSSIQRYYDAFRDPFFTRRVKKIGAWGWHNPPPSQLPTAGLYAFHEAGGETWKTEDQGMHGYEHEGVNMAKSVGDFERLAKLADDEKLGIYSLPYTIVGQRQIYRLPTMPKDRDAALKAFETWTADEPIIFQTPGPSVSFNSVAQLKELIRNSNIYDEQQQPVVMIREYLGNTVTFPLNPNPNLYSDTKKETIAKYALEQYLPMLFNGSKFIDGCYVDSLGRWCGYYNFRPDHFKYSTVPLTYSGETPRPCLWNLQSHAEYLWELSRQLHAQDKIVFANGVHVNRVMLGFAVDAMGMEGLPKYDGGDGFYSARVAAYQKPYCALNGRNSANSAAWNSALYLGYLIGARGPAGEKLERKYLPTIIAMNEAGWEPITHARTENPVVGIERWGGGKDRGLFFSLLNRSGKEVETKVRIDSQTLGLTGKVTIVDRISGSVLTATATKNELRFPVTLEPGKAMAVMCGAQRP